MSGLDSLLKTFINRSILVWPLHPIGIKAATIMMGGQVITTAVAEDH